MNNQIVGYCIIDTESGQRWGDLYESERGAKASFNSWVKQTNYYRPNTKPKFNEQSQYVIHPVWLINE
jgi:hypothetical protein